MAAAAGAVTSVAADVFSAYDPEAAFRVRGQWNVAFAALEPLFRAKSPHDMLVGHWLAALGIPTMALGVVALARLFRPERRWAMRLFGALSAVAFVFGLLTHASLGYVGLVVRYAARAPSTAANQLAADTARFFEPVAVVFAVAMVAATAVLAFAVAAGWTRLPRLYAPFSPLPIQLGLFGAAVVAPPPLATLIWVTSYNLSFVLALLGLLPALRRL